MKKLFFFILAFFSISSVVFAQNQTVQQLENERRETLRRIETTNQMLNQTQRSRQSSVNKVNLLNANIRERQSLINTINQEVSQLNAEIIQLNFQQQELTKQLNVLKADYARFVQESYLNRSFYNKMMFVFSAENFNQSMRRLRYLQEFTNYRKEQVAEIERVTAEIEEKSQEVERHRLTRLSIAQQRESEAQKLTQDRTTEQRMLNDLRGRERTLQAEIQAQQRRAQQLNQQIERIIAEEVRRSQQQAAPGETLTPEQQLIAGNFEANRGRLPWPVERGVISGKFGRQPHPVLRNVTTDNNGIFIQTPQGSEARAVFEGVVAQRFSIPGNNNVVIVQHGNYFTLYANLTEIFVRQGEKVTARQRIGRIFTNTESDNQTILEFQLLKETNRLNPELWIAR
jgi:septal ring factor EnvC (AmiA/AmiB activator)